MADMDQDEIDKLLAEAAEITGDPVAPAPTPETERKAQQTSEDDSVFDLPLEEELHVEEDSSELSELLADLPQAKEEEEALHTDKLEEVDTEKYDADALSGSILDQAELNAMMQDATSFTEEPKDSTKVSIDFLLDMELTLSFEVGRAKMKINDLLSLGQGSVVELHRLVGEDLDLFVSGHLIAKGEVVVVNEKFGIRIISIIPPSERIQRMAGMDSL